METKDLICRNPECEEIVEPARAALGYRTCIHCGSPRKQFTVSIPFNKGPYMLISSDMVQHIGR